MELQFSGAEICAAEPHNREEEREEVSDGRWCGRLHCGGMNSVRGYDIQREGARLLWDGWQDCSKLEKSIAKRGAGWLSWKRESFFVSVVGCVARMFGGSDRGFVGDGRAGGCAGAGEVVESSFSGGGLECDTLGDGECGAVVAGAAIG